MKNKKQLTLPRKDKDGNPYLSYSQINMWKNKRRDYIRQYFLGEDDDNVGLQKYGDFGHLVGEAFENNDFSAFDDEETEFLKTVPRYDEFEREVKLEIDGAYLKGFIDTSTLPKTYVKKIADYKTGNIQKKEGDYSSEDYIQVEIYAAALEQEFGKAPEDCKVFLIGREGNAFKGEDLKLTKEFITIDREITPEVIESVKKEVQSIAEEISSYYQVFLKLNKKL